MDFAYRSRSYPILLLILTYSFFFVSSTINLTNASIHIYDKESLNEVGNAYLLSGGSEGIFASDSSTPNGRSYIRFRDITFWRTKDAADEHSEMEHSTGLVQVVIFEAADRNNIGGSAYGGQRSICCTPDLAKLEGCKQGEVIRIPSATDIKWPIVLNVQFSGNYLSTNIRDEYVNITKTGMYNLFFITCDPKLKGLIMSGKTVWKNPDGYLPGRMAPLMKFYVLMSLAYLLLSVIWFTQYMSFWKDILQLQHCITAVIALGLFEMILWYSEYANFNSTGTRPVAITTWVVTVGAIRKTLARLLMLSISMGYGVVRPTLGVLPQRARLFLVLPDAFLDAFLILWIFTSLSRTLEQLQAKRSSVKLDYRKFSNALAVAVIASVAWIAYEVYFKATDPFNERWLSAWIITAFWDILALALLCVICYLWAPSQSSQRYAYSEEAGEESDDEEAHSLTRERQMVISV
ncbi:hypothetical protein GH714_004496 [Hevea brasiliensis]|uniref:GOST seven transmembrane domain-containing protein n=1 Tax=Hevea brasiliensis TaxID=3981 RepID=A0A6A6L079_HEVBR|nr:hypothetical protein GH714_004496 [Hevea brasiliensis]